MCKCCGISVPLNGNTKMTDFSKDFSNLALVGDMNTTAQDVWLRQFGWDSYSPDEIKLCLFH